MTRVGTTTQFSLRTVQTSNQSGGLARRGTEPGFSPYKGPARPSLPSGGAGVPTLSLRVSWTTQGAAPPWAPRTRARRSGRTQSLCLPGDPAQGILLQHFRAQEGQGVQRGSCHFTSSQETSSFFGLEGWEVGSTPAIWDPDDQYRQLTAVLPLELGEVWGCEVQGRKRLVKNTPSAGVGVGFSSPLPFLTGRGWRLLQRFWTEGALGHCRAAGADAFSFTAGRGRPPRTRSPGADPLFPTHLSLGPASSRQAPNHRPGENFQVISV